VIKTHMGAPSSDDSRAAARKVPLPMEPAQSFRIGGSLQIMARDGAMLVINEIGMEEYVKGVVPSEMSAGWHPEALKVQAVATRTYALYQRVANAGREFDVVATTQDQVYRGRQGVDERVQQAVEATRGIVITYQDAPILAAFSSTAAGPTEDAMNVWSKDLPYLKGVECPFDENSPYYQWRVEVPVLSLEQSLRKQGIPVGTIATVTPFLYSRAGRVDKIRILHSDGEVILRGQDFRKAVGYSIIPSTQFDIEALGRMIVFAGRGSGHAVGLCQWGAKELADQGYSYDAILRYYFPGTALQQTALLHLSSR
jgi:stage II sporulation protein D